MRKEVKIIGIVLLVLAALFLIPWRFINWGKVETKQPEVVIVTGEGSSQEKNQIASFNAGINIIRDKKEEAINEVNQKTKELIDSVKNFGIPEADIKTQNMSVYQMQDPGRVEVNNKWSVNNSIEVILRDVNKTNELADLLNKSGANNVYGPNFRMDENNNQTGINLYNSAIGDAREKAEIIAKTSGRKLGKVVGVVEGGSSNNIYPMYSKAEGMGGAVSEPGSSTVTKVLTVTFELE